MKTCFKCGEMKELSCFYRHKQMADGHVNKCKECNKRDVQQNRLAHIEYYREYDRVRGNRQPAEYMEKYREQFPKKYRAHTLVARAIKAGNLFVMPCETCKTDDSVHAHHDDYAKPLNVRWLCAAHHKQWHMQNGEAANAT